MKHVMGYRQTSWTLKDVGELVEVIVFREITDQFAVVFPAPAKVGKVSKYGTWSSYSDRKVAGA